MDFPFSYLTERAVYYLLFLVPLYLSQRYWFRLAWRSIEGVPRGPLRWALRVAWAAALLALVVPFIERISSPARRSIPESSSAIGHVILWLMASFPAYVAVKLVEGIETLWSFLRKPRAPQVRPSPLTTEDAPANPSRRLFFQTATVVAGATPVVGILYGYLAGRVNYRVERVELPLANLPAELDGLRIAQLSDFHAGGYMTREHIRRAVDMTNDLGAELAVVTGDYITWSRAALEGCVEELARLRAPLGVWGCLGNHEIYANCEGRATELLGQAGVRILRSANASVMWRGQTLNLIGVDYQRARTEGRSQFMLSGVERLVRSDVPNILLSHNPNVFPRAASMGIELTLAGHTHGGQVDVEILDRHFTPLHYVTEFVAGLFRRTSPGAPHESFLYVNRGLGTIGAPVRINAPPEITLLTLRRA